MRIRLAVLFVTCISARAVALQYTIYDLGEIAGFLGYSVNNQGSVAGSAYPGSIAAIWSGGGGFTSLGTLPGYTNSFATAINDAGQAAGSCYGQSHAQRGFFWQNGTMTDMGTLGPGDTYISRMNGPGQVVGRSNGRPFLYANGQIQDIGTLFPSGYGIAGGNNDQGDIVGQGAVSTSAPRMAFLYREGQETWIHPAFARESIGVDINNSGRAALEYENQSNAWRPAIWENGVTTDLGTPFGGDVGGVADINNRGDVIGYATSIDASYSALWKDGQTYRLIDLIQPGTNWNLSYKPSAINDDDWIVGLGFRYGEGERGYLMVPVSEPGAQTVLLFGLSAVIVTRFAKPS